MHHTTVPRHLTQRRIDTKWYYVCLYITGIPYAYRLQDGRLPPVCEQCCARKAGPLEEVKCMHAGPCCNVRLPEIFTDLMYSARREIRGCYNYS